MIVDMVLSVLNQVAFFSIGARFELREIFGLLYFGRETLFAFAFSCYGSGTEPYQFRSTIRKTVGLTNVDIRRKR